jgi:hypothetical protein
MGRETNSARGPRRHLTSARKVSGSDLIDVPYRTRKTINVASANFRQSSIGATVESSSHYIYSGYGIGETFGLLVLFSGTE